jgi:small multidrug resistance family-3 protein
MLTNMEQHQDTTSSIESLTKEKDESSFQWTTVSILQSLFLFGAAGVAGIVGGWMIWIVFRGNDTGKKPWWYALLGSTVLVAYGFIPCLQPTDSFGRIYAAYGGFFIVMSFLFGWALDGDRPDRGDVVGGSIVLVGAGVIFFWPRH